MKKIQPATRDEILSRQKEAMQQQQQQQVYSVLPFLYMVLPIEIQ